jgi:hypothetical protein
VTQNSVGKREMLVVSMPEEKKVPEHSSGLRPSEKELPERRSVIKIPLLISMYRRLTLLDAFSTRDYDL